METQALLLAATLQAGTVLALAALGLLINEKSGVVNLGAEGMMLCAALAGFATVVHTGSDMLGFLAGMGSGALLAAVFGVLVIGLGTNAYATGLALSLFGAGLSAFAGLSYVKEQLPDRIGLVTGIWTAVMAAGASLGAALTVPVGTWLGSWKWGLAAWVVPAAIAWLVWGAVEQPHRATVVRRPASRFSDLPWRDPLAWRVTIFIATNSFGFCPYSLEISMSDGPTIIWSGRWQAEQFCS